MTVPRRTFLRAAWLASWAAIAWRTTGRPIAQPGAVQAEPEATYVTTLAWTADAWHVETRQYGTGARLAAGLGTERQP